MSRLTQLFGSRKNPVARRRAVDRRGRLAFEALEGRQMLSSIPTATALSASTATAVYGRPVAFTATVTANVASKPTGAVQFVIDGTPYGKPLPLSGGTASTSDAALAVGSHTITAVYQPANSILAPLTFAGSTSTGFKETVTSDATTTAVSASANPSSVGQPMMFTATVANASVPGGSTPTGAVQFAIDGGSYGKPVSLNGGTASISDGALTVGSHTITAVYQPANSTFASSTSNSFKETIANATTTTVSSSASPSSFGQPVTFKATVANATVPGGTTPTGAVQFVIDGASYGQTVPLSGGTASINDAALAAGSHTITAVYQPVGTFAGSTSASFKETITVDATTTTVSSSASSSSFGQPVTFTATVANATVPGGSTPVGSVQFKIDGAAYGTPVTLSNGMAVISDAALAAGSHTIAATFLPSTGSFSTSTSPTGTQAVNADATTTKLAVSAVSLRFGIPAQTGSAATASVSGASLPGVSLSLTLTATVANASAHGAGTPTGTVQFQLNGTPVGAPQTLSGGQASLTISPFAAVNPTLTVVYTPSTGNFSASSATLSTTQFPLAVATLLAGQGAAPSTIATALRDVSGAVTRSGQDPRRPGPDRRAGRRRAQGRLRRFRRRRGRHPQPGRILTRRDRQLPGQCVQFAAQPDRRAAPQHPGTIAIRRDGGAGRRRHQLYLQRRRLGPGHDDRDQPGWDAHHNHLQLRRHSEPDWHRDPDQQQRRSGGQLCFDQRRRPAPGFQELHLLQQREALP